MRKNEPISKVMQPADAAASVHIDQKLSEVRRKLAAPGVHHVAVLSGQTLMGMISATDMLKMTFTAYGGDERSFDAYLDHEFKIADVMTRSLNTLSTESSVREAVHQLAEGMYHAVPVVDALGHFAGLVTSTDLLRHMRTMYE